ncbi:latent-transforming growth factor beta-binding protein 2-like [Pocillopora verrucosa]|uniref:latent-transforming growth factor beta-binding protein 2-like n=1 Tax=Pocillopora verrucosa TaxID=203993 RepID=UPI00333EAB0C
MTCFGVTAITVAPRIVADVVADWDTKGHVARRDQESVEVSCPWRGTCTRKSCQDVDECINNPCQHNCTNTHGSYTCKCNSCYTKLGTKCDLRQCKINNHCHAYGTVNPSNHCQDCNDSDKFAWTNNNTLPCTDGKACTKNDRCSNGVCSGTPFSCLPCEECQNDVCRVKPGYCVINESGIRQCFNHGSLRPGHQCQDCNDSDKFAWTNNNTLPCTDGKACTKNDRCSNGVCSGTPFSCLPCEECQNDVCRVKPRFCVINESGIRQCFNHGSLRPGHQCQECDSNHNDRWTNNNNLKCNDTNLKTKDDRCLSGTCVGTLYNCLSCETHDGSGCPIEPGYCIIQQVGQRKCYATNHYKPGNPCQRCDISKNLSTWSDNDG